MSETRDNGATLWKRLLSLLRGRGDESLRDSIEELLEEHADDSATPEETAERALLRNVLEVGELRVGEIRVPRTDIIAVPLEIEFEKLVKTLVDAEHSRLPIYRGNLDDVIGMIHVKDVLPYLSGARSNFAREGDAQAAGGAAVEIGARTAARDARHPRAYGHRGR